MLVNSSDHFCGVQKFAMLENVVDHIQPLNQLTLVMIYLNQKLVLP